MYCKFEFELNRFHWFIYPLSALSRRDVVNRFKGPFEAEMSRTEAQLILNVKSSASSAEDVKKQHRLA
jgi:hypothetical protein